jgi:DNA-binding NarL/FixJ family response regulator
MTKVMPIDDYSDIVADEMPRLKVLLVDDHTLFRESLQFILGKCEDITVVGQAGDGYEALDKVRTLKPDVVLLDINMPSTSYTRL